MLVGAYAVAAHGLPRATGDMDLWIKVSNENAERVRRALQKFGAPLLNIMKSDLMQPGNVIQLGVTPRRIDILTEITGVQFTDAVANRLMLDIEGLKIPVIGRADLIKNKKAVGRPQDNVDAARLEEES